ncbi:hypothetical protein GMJLKIPL_4944 [Methylobacterium isbiliense]|uniref:Uncharacterized protein n=1 Tax=Methylobacterium isbiliense TaxID=315478 RepID=A0ABQ4SM84_9HYPH|nr:hypothetical protein GMJLKIPL_4944 [Methylobacterium isbiliense]
MRDRLPSLPQGCSDQDLAEPWEMLQRVEHLPGLRCQSRSHQRWELPSGVERGAPLPKPSILVPIEIVNERIPLPLGFEQAILEEARGPVENGVDRRKLLGQIIWLDFGIFWCVVDLLSILNLIVIRVPLPSFRAVRALATAELHEPCSAESPRRLVCRHEPSGSQDRASPRQLVGWCPDVHAGVMQDEVLEVDEFAGEPERRAGVVKVGAAFPAACDRTGAQPLVKPREGIFGDRKRPPQDFPSDREVNGVSYCSQKSLGGKRKSTST